PGGRLAGHQLRQVRSAACIEAPDLLHQPRPAGGLPGGYPRTPDRVCADCVGVPAAQVAARSITACPICFLVSKAACQRLMGQSDSRAPVLLTQDFPAKASLSGRAQNSRPRAGGPKTGVQTAALLPPRQAGLGRRRPKVALLTP